MLSAFFNPPIQPAAVLAQQEASHPEALAKDAMRLGIAGRACDPLLSDLVLSRGEPLLRQHLDQTRLQIEDVQRKRRIILSLRRVTRGDNQLINRAQLRRYINLVHARCESKRDLKVRKRRRGSIDALGRLLKPSGQLREIESFELARIKRGQADASSLRTPDAEL